MTRLKRNLKDNMDTITASAAHHFMADGFVPWHLYERAKQFGVLPGSFKTRILNRVELMNTPIIERTLKRTLSPAGLLGLGKEVVMKNNIGVIAVFPSWYFHQADEVLSGERKVLITFLTGPYYNFYETK